MKQILYRRFLIVAVLLGSIWGTGLILDKYSKEKETVDTKDISDDRVLVGGMPIGIYMDMDGVLILGTEEIESLDGTLSEPAHKAVCSGDYILKINEMEVDNKKELIDVVNNLENEEVSLTLRRGGEVLTVEFEAIEIEENQFKLGIWVRDSIQGLGTITYLTSESEFGALGHGIHDVDTESLIKIDEGYVYDIDIVGIQKGQKGEPGGLEGVIIYNEQNVLGEIYYNKVNGIYGKIEDVTRLFKGQKTVEICEKRDVKLGKAELCCALDGEVETYDIEIKSIDYFSRNENKGLVIEVVDERLIEKTGGIIQGMSGSPIVQNGKLVGAVTHVLVNDPTRGYGIFIENMLDAAE